MIGATDHFREGDFVRVVTDCVMERHRNKTGIVMTAQPGFNYPYLVKFIGLEEVHFRESELCMGDEMDYVRELLMQ